MSHQRFLTLYPYLLDGTCWVFDDERTGLKEEAFVLGMTEMISRAVEGKGIHDAAKGFALSFSDEPFDGHDVELHWLRSDGCAGNWYEGTVVGQRMEGWLCPALLLYFEQAPRRIFIRCDPLPAGVNPIWTPKRGDTVRRFVEAPQVARSGLGGKPIGTVDASSRHHHLWNNRGVWSVHYTLNFDCRTRRVRRALKAGSLNEAIRHRDDLLARHQAEGEDLPAPHAVKCAAKFYGLAANEYRAAGLGLLARTCWREAARNHERVKVNEEAERCLVTAAEVQEYWDGGAS